jgi:hypothetical protein
MAIYAQFDKDGPCIQLASNVGWSEFGDWVEHLDGATRISKLWSEGNQEDIAGLRDELEEILEKSPPENADVLSVADGIIHAIDAGGAAEILIISSGVQIDPPPEKKRQH